MESFVFPGNIEPEISLIASRPIPYMRTAAFSACSEIFRTNAFALDRLSDR